MSSVFLTQSPSFSINDAKRIIKDHFHFQKYYKVDALYSDRDQIFRISSKTEKYILKIFNYAEKESIIQLQLSAIDYISRNNPKILLPIPVKDFIHIKKDKKIFMSCLYKYIEGDFLYKKKLNLNQYHKMGEFIGQISTALNGFQNSGSKRVFEWDIQDLTLIYKRLNYIKSKTNQETVSYFLAQYENNVVPHVANLRKSVIHNDGNDHNILINSKDQRMGIIDFGDMVYSFQALEPAVCMAYIALEKKDTLTKMSSFLRGYQSCFPLLKNELQCIIYMICIRLCLTVSMAAWRKTIFPKTV